MARSWAGAGSGKAVCILLRSTARQLDEVFCLEEERVVSADWVVSYKSRLLQLERQSRYYAPARSRVVVRENQQGELAVVYRGRPLRFREITVRAAPAAAPADFHNASGNGDLPCRVLRQRSSV